MNCYRAEYKKSLLLRKICIMGVKYKSTFTNGFLHSTQDIRERLTVEIVNNKTLIC